MLVTLKPTKTKSLIATRKGERTVAIHDPNRCRYGHPCIIFMKVKNYQEALDVLIVEPIHHVLDRKFGKIDYEFERFHERLDRRSKKRNLTEKLLKGQLRLSKGKLIL